MPEVEKSEEKQSLPRRIALAFLKVILIAGLIFYILYHITNGYSAEMKTLTVKPASEAITLDLTGTTVRSEQAVTAINGGICGYVYPDGTKVKINAKVATVYGASGSSSVIAELAELDRSIEMLGEADISGNTTVADGIAADKEILQTLTVSADSRARGQFGKLSQYADELVRVLAKRNVILTGGSGVADVIVSLTSQRQSLLASLSGDSIPVRTPLAGYFYSYTDGYESVFDYDSITSLTPSGYENILGKAAESVNGAVGKIVLYPKWYLLCPCDKQDALSLKAGKYYTVVCNTDDCTFNMKLTAKNDENNRVLLVFETQEMPEGFSFDRTQKVSITTDTISGYRLPSSALRMVDGKVGVYVRSGNTIRFRLADVIYESGAYVFVSTETEGKTLFSDDDDAGNDVFCKGLALYDSVIISGAKDLSPDKIVN